MCMITRCRSFWCLHFSFTEKHDKKGGKNLAATCQQHCYIFSRHNSKKIVQDHGAAVRIIGERRDPPIPGRFVESAEEIIALVWDGHSAFIWVNGAEGEIFSRSLTLCQHVEKRRLPENENSCEPSEAPAVRRDTLKRHGNLRNTVSSGSEMRKYLCDGSEQNI